MLDLKTMKLALEQLETERKIPKEKIIEAIEQALAAAYKKDYGKKGQIVRAHFNMDTGETEFYQVKIVVDESTVYMPKDTESEEEEIRPEGDERTRFNPEHHILLEDAHIIKRDAQVEDELIFPLELKEDFGRVAAQTAKQVIIQKIRDAEKAAVLDEFGTREGEIISGIVQKMERGIITVEFNRATGIILPQEQIRGEIFHRGERIRAYLYDVEEGPRGVTLRLSRTHPQMIKKLFEMEAPEVASGVVEIKSIAREAGARSKIAVATTDPNIDPVGSCVGQKGIRVTTVMSELGGEKIDIIEWSEDPSTFVAKALSPAKVLDIVIDAEQKTARVDVADDQLSLAIGKAGQNVRLAAKLTGWRIDIKGVSSSDMISSDENKEEDGFVSLADLKKDVTEESTEEKDADPVEAVEESIATEAPAEAVEETEEAGK